ncbi:MAG: 4-hydroxythreonine-4-phosphate dehydrogenase PdxA [Hyphomonadaceae bacterium]|nr:4-hydroxythreonine-4-phosphate dehydrogenase PdxA [Hyphomonadaceae bacterium]
MTSPLPLALTLGDPAGCGPHIAELAWTQSVGRKGAPFYIITPSHLLPGNVPVRTIKHPSETAEVFPTALPVFPLDMDLQAPPPGQPDVSTAPAIMASITTAVEHTLDGQARAVVTNPISKSLLYEAGFRFPGHTEFLAHLAERHGGGKCQPIMMLVGGGLRVALATIHMPLREAVDALSAHGLVEIGEIVAKALKQDFGLPAPKLAFTGLNPHAGEEGALGREEIEIINPAAQALRARGVEMSDARPADTVFAEALSGRFDAVIAMTHDQGLIPVKTLDMWGGVNTTLGLPFVRTSPDHGTAYEATASGQLRPDSLIAALALAARMAEARHG